MGILRFVSSTDIMSILTVKNKLFKPQDPLLSREIPSLAEDGKTIEKVNEKEKFSGSYQILFFFPLGLKSDSEEVLKFSSSVKQFEELECKVVGVTNESPLAVRRWMEKDVESGGFGQVVGFQILSDKDLTLSMSMGVARTCGLPARSVFIVDPKSFVRHSIVQRADIKHSMPELLRLVAAIKRSDETGMATPAGWHSDDSDLIPIDYTEKVAYFKKKYGPNSIDQSVKSVSSTKSKSGSLNISEQSQKSSLNSVSTSNQSGSQESSRIEEKPRNPEDSVQVAEVQSDGRSSDQTQKSKLSSISVSKQTGSQNGSSGATEEKHKNQAGSIQKGEVKKNDDVSAF